AGPSGSARGIRRRDPPGAVCLRDPPREDSASRTIAPACEVRQPGSGPRPLRIRPLWIEVRRRILQWPRPGGVDSRGDFLLTWKWGWADRQPGFIHDNKEWK